MIETIFFEEQISNHPTTERIRKALPRSTWVPIERYQELFNKRHQNFKLQKKNPALILAKKHVISFYQFHQVLEWTPIKTFISHTCTTAFMIVNIVSSRGCTPQQILSCL